MPEDAPGKILPCPACRQPILVSAPASNGHNETKALYILAGVGASGLVLMLLLAVVLSVTSPTKTMPVGDPSRIGASKELMRPPDPPGTKE